jgi:hypothetical protein
MANRFDALPSAIRWRVLVDAGKQAAREQGYLLSRVPGRGLSNVWSLKKDGKSQLASLRTTRDRWIAFPPLKRGTKWKTLDDVELVVIAAVDSKEDPKNVEVYIFPAEEVRKRFNAAYAARAKAGQVIRDDFGMWVALDADMRGIAASVGSGIVEHFKRVATYSIDALLSSRPDQSTDAEEEALIDDGPMEESARPSTIAEVMAWARERVAEIAGVRVEAVKLDLKVEY